MPTMAFIVSRAGRRSEIRESVTTPAGPRSRTLATFDALSSGVLDHASTRASAALDIEALKAEARRSSIPVELPVAERAARTLATQLSQGAAIPPALRAVLAELLHDAAPAGVSDAARAAAGWADASPRERGEALHDLLLLADALPQPRLTRPPLHPPLHSAAAR